MPKVSKSKYYIAAKPKSKPESSSSSPSTEKSKSSKLTYDFVDDDDFDEIVEYERNGICEHVKDVNVKLINETCNHFKEHAKTNDVITINQHFPFLF